MGIVLLFIIWRVGDFIIALAAPRFIPYLGFFPYGEMFKEYGLPAFISSFANFDGAQYLTLVREGYNMYTQAYFPLYFILVRIVSLLFPTPHAVRLHNDLLAGLCVSNIAFAVGLFVFYRYLQQLYIKTSCRGVSTNVLAPIFFLLLFPTSFFFGAFYTEGLFFLLVISSLYFLKKQKYFLAVFFAGLSSATRLMGIFLFVPFFLHFFHFDNLRLIENQKLKIKNWIKLFVLFSPFIGFILYSIYLWITVKDPLFFFHTQPVFGANRSTNLILLPQVYYRYFKIFFTAQFNFQYFVSLVEFFIFSFVFIILVIDLLKIIKFNTNFKFKILNYDRFALNMFSMINIVLPTLTGTFSSIPRYSLLSLSMFIYLGELKNNMVKIVLLASSFLLHIVLLGFFIQGYFIG